MNLSHTHAHGLCVRAFRNSGVPAHDASLVADVLVEAELWGKPTHGLKRVPGLVERWRAKPREPVRVLTQGPAHLHIDAGGQFGYVVLRAALDQALAKAADAGVCVVGIRNSDHCGIAGYYAWLGAEAGFVTALTCDCFPRAAPHGATSPVFGTNPIAVAVPVGGHPIVLDFSIAEMTNGLMAARRDAGRSLPQGIAFDREGNPTTCPAQGLQGAVKVFGGHKGSGIAIVAQLLCTALVGAAPLPEIGKDYGYFLLVIDPEIFVPADEFRSQAKVLLDAVKAARTKTGHDEVLLPGERSWRAKAHALEHGIDVPDDVVATLTRMAEAAPC